MFTPVDRIEETEKALSAAQESKNIIAPVSVNESVSADESTHADKSTRVNAVEAPVSAPVRENVHKAVAMAENTTEVISDIGENIPASQAEGFRYLSSRSFVKAEPEKKAETAESEPASIKEEPKIRVIGEAFKNYIMAEAGDSIVMIDKHAAHERIIFERLKSRNCRQYSQVLMTPCRVLLSMKEFDALQSNEELLRDMGFEFDFSQAPCAVATAVPTFLMELDFDEIIPEIAENLCLGKQNPQLHILDDMLHTVACKSAIKANDKTDIRELQALAEQVYNNENIRHCPHGRPVMFTMTKGNIEHQFRRT